MNAVRSLVLAGALLISTGALADEGILRWNAPQHLIGINPLSLLFGELSLEYEQGLGHSASLLFSPSAIVFPGLYTPFAADTHLQGFGLMIGLHFFPYPNGLNGFWIGPELTGRYVSISAPAGEGTAYGIAVAGALGYTFIIADHFGISLGVGAGYQKVWGGAAFTDGSSSVFLAGGLALSGRLSFSYAF